MCISERFCGPAATTARGENQGQIIAAVATNSESSFKRFRFDVMTGSVSRCLSRTIDCGGLGKTRYGLSARRRRGEMTRRVPSGLVRI